MQPLLHSVHFNITPFSCMKIRCIGQALKCLSTTSVKDLLLLIKPLFPVSFVQPSAPYLYIYIYIYNPN